MVLPDLLRPGLTIVFCGTAAGADSAKRQAYYARRGNRFWPILHKCGLTPRLFQPEEFALLLAHDIGLTDLCKRTYGSDASLVAEDFDVPGFRARIQNFSPKIVAFNGVKPGRIALGNPRLKAGPAADLGQSRTYVLPSSSSAANGTWDESHWFALAALARGC